MAKPNHQLLERVSGKPNEALKTLRRAMGIKQSDFADLVHFSPSQIASVESGRRSASPEFAWQIAAITGVSAKSIEEGTGKPLDWRGQAYSAKSYEDFKNRPSIKISNDTLEQILSPLKTVLQAAALVGCLKDCTLKIKKEFEFLITVLPGLKAAVNQQLRPTLSAKTQVTVSDIKRDPELAQKLGFTKDANILRTVNEDFVVFSMNEPSPEELWTGCWYREGTGDSDSANSFGNRESRWH
jgi:transcriptional regulator with XRE-family HTH domain